MLTNEQTSIVRLALQHLRSQVLEDALAHREVESLCGEMTPADAIDDVLASLPDMVIVRVNADYNALEFWESVASYLDSHRDQMTLECASALASFLDADRDTFYLSIETWGEVWEVLETLPGWEDGPEHAVHPLIWD